MQLVVLHTKKHPATGNTGSPYHLGKAEQLKPPYLLPQVSKETRDWSHHPFQLPGS